jgi:hypothetical protein
MFCPQCGATLPEGVKFCTKCGAKISSEMPTLKTTPGDKTTVSQVRKVAPWLFLMFGVAVTIGSVFSLSLTLGLYPEMDFYNFFTLAAGVYAVIIGVSAKNFSDSKLALHATILAAVAVLSGLIALSIPTFTLMTTLTAFFFAGLHGFVALVLWKQQ